MTETPKDQETELKDLKKELSRLRLEANLRKSLATQLEKQKKVAEDAKAEAQSKTQQMEDGADGNPYPRLGYEEKSILSDIYLRDHYTKQSSKTLRGIYDPSISGAISGSGNDWIELREGDTTIKRSATTMANSASNRISLSKEFKALAIEAQDRIKDLIYAYNMYGSKPRQVAGIDAPDLSLSGNHTT